MSGFPRAIAVASLACVAVNGSASAQTLPTPPPVRAPHAMVVSVHHEASDAGLAVLKQGGNAVDAAVAVAFALAVVYPEAGNIGGGGFMLIKPAHKRGAKKLGDGKAHFIDYREEAPAAASRDMYLDKDGNVVKGMSTQGYAASGVPGTVAGMAYAEEHYGKLGLKAAMQPAIKLARDGFVGTEEELNVWHSALLKKNAEAYRIYQRNGDFYKAGEVIKQPELAATLERIAADPNEFYHGRMADQIAEEMKSGGGTISKADLEGYSVKDRAPLVGRYHGYEITTAPPPSSGGIVLLETLNILTGYDLKKMGGDRSPQQVHLITEAFRRAFMDRSDYLGDPDFTKMPLAQMSNRKYAEAWRRTIDPVKASVSKDLVRPAGFMPEPPKQKGVTDHTETTHFSVVDADGNAVSNTYTLNFYFGSGVVVKGLGFAMNDEMDDFTSKVGVPNGFGLIQGPNNAIAPHKRPLSAMTPTVVTKRGKLRLVLGSPGGPTIISTVTNDLISVLDNGLNVQEAADAPRFHNQYLPDELQVEKRFSAATGDVLKANGYNVKRSGEFDEHNPGIWGDSELIAVDPKTGELLGGHDTRKGFGKASGY
ncbi:gamma-glutamyltransferase 1 [Terriglobus roseus DSM 18391]|uniref:Glutathione hydrolase proenzyme n=1 Tax=Terriglobus roseus (strain DSM 18391 / NRRL B-41598 / KBS 63) TaxID=926566 RepID=I3ZLP1_TERRK|nr:gamma-glutamyltransferase [Terriglobus roseus]AFL90159.1 gamma-glutamyltransferase 1 [Terriglobus roseus DSM 18391]